MKYNKLIAVIIALVFVVSAFVCISSADAEESSFKSPVAAAAEKRADRICSSVSSSSDAAILAMSKNTEQTPTEGDWYTVTTEADPLNLRQEPRQEAAVCGKIPRGGFVFVTEKEGIWGLTLYDGTTGWLNLSYCQPGQVALSPSLPEENTQTVYVTNTGECYHRSGCSYLRSKIPISLEDAKAGYRPCSRCQPPQ